MVAKPGSQVSILGEWPTVIINCHQSITNAYYR